MKKIVASCILSLAIAVIVIVPNAGHLVHSIDSAYGELFPPINEESITIPVEQA